MTPVLEPQQIAGQAKNESTLFHAPCDDYANIPRAG